ncbi:MAG: chemotaxis protein CheW [Salinirussus sp.]
MSENERMERARRIRQMREGDREDEDDEQDREQMATTGQAGTADPAPPAGTTDGGTEAAAGAAATPDVDGDVSAPLPSTEAIEAAVDEDAEAAESDDGAGGETATAAGPAPTGVGEEAATTTGSETETRVLEFGLDGERYCLDIEYVEEIVEEETVTRVPNTPDFVEGVVDLRGQITTIVNPKEIIEKEDRSAGDLIVVLDADAFDDQGHVGWIVDDVHQVAPVDEEEINETPLDDDRVDRIVDREDDDAFVIWTDPDLVFEAVE